MTYAAIFDMDGVLVDSGAAHRQAWYRLGEEVGMPFTAQLFDRSFGMHNNQIVPLWLGREAAATEIERLADRKETFYRDLVVTLMKPVEGVVDLLHRLRSAGVMLAVGSSGPRANVELVLAHLDVAPLFTALSTGEDVHHGKPHPEVFLVAAQRLGRQPAECIVFEDAPQGVEAARRGGMKVVAITSSRGRAELSDADMIVDTFMGLTPAAVGALLA